MTDLYCTFYVAGMWLGLRATQVKEVVQNRNTTPLPLAPKNIRGLINLRGDILTVIDLRERFHAPAANGEDNAIHVVVDDSGTPVSLLVDSVGEMVTAGPDSILSTPSNLDRLSKELLLGAIQHNGSLLLLLNAQRASSVVVRHITHPHRGR